MSYQERWVRGEVLETGQRECSERYELIRPVVAGYTRPVTVLDLGANLGYFGLRLAHEFGAVSVMVESRPILEEACRENALPTTIALRRRLSVEDLEQLAATEHFDVVLALNVVHHFKNDWRRALDAIALLGDNLVVETPPDQDVKACGQGVVRPLLTRVQAIASEKLGEAKSHTTPGVRRPVYLVRRKKTMVPWTCVNAAKVGAGRARPHAIASTASEKRVVFPPTRKSGVESRDWVHGINLWTWCELGGVYPSADDIVASMTRAYEQWPDHGDLHPWNFVLQGDRVVMIDGHHRYTFGGPESFAKSISWIRNPTGAYK